LRIAILTPADPNKVGGVEKVVREFSVRLSREHSVEVFCMGPQPEEFTIGNVPVHVLKEAFGLHVYSPKLRHDIEAASPDLLYVHNYGSYMPYVAYRIKKRNTAVKFVLHPHYHPRGSSNLYNMMRMAYTPGIGSRIVSSADAVIANSKAELRVLKETFPQLPPSFVIPNGIDIQGISKSRRMDLPTETVVALGVGRLVNYKNPLEAVRIVKYLPDQFQLFFAGDGPLRDQIFSLSRQLGVQSRIHLLGHVTDAELYSWYKTASTLIHLSNLESFGMTCVEALAAGTPSVANDDGYGLSETIDMFPRFIARCDVRRDNPKEMADLVVRMSGMKPVAADLSEFSWDSLSGRLESIIESLTRKWHTMGAAEHNDYEAASFDQSSVA
jgi:glycosyltransferase involved in cell wall biosynthesis